MTTLFTDAGKFLDSTIDSAISTVEGWFAPSDPEPEALNRQQLQALMEVMAQMLAMQKALGAKDIDPQQ